MARQAGPIFFIGTVDDLVFYKLDECYYVRKKSSISRKRFQKDPAYELPRLRAGQFGQAAKLASEVYRFLPKAQKKHGLFGQFTKIARQLLHEGRTPEEVVAFLSKKYLSTSKSAASKPLRSCLHSGVTTLPVGDLPSSLPNHSQALLNTPTHLLGLINSESGQQEKRPEYDSSLSLPVYDG